MATTLNQDQFEQLADEIEGLEVTYTKSLQATLENLGHDASLTKSRQFQTDLNNFVFVCAGCDCWLKVEQRNHVSDDEYCDDCMINLEE